MLPLCDTVLIACALAPETKGLIDSRRLALMKPGALLINVARAAIVDEDALYAALKDGHLGGAALDVWWQYPTQAEPERRPSRRPFHELPNVLITPHRAEACGRHGAADAFKACQHNGALRRTGRGAPELDLKRPEQSLKLVQRVVPQLAAGDDLRHPISPVCREAPTIRAFPAVTGVIVVRERPVGGGSKRLKSGEKGRRHRRCAVRSARR
jgi:hypothetical protein